MNTMVVYIFLLFFSTYSMINGMNNDQNQMLAVESFLAQMHDLIESAANKLKNCDNILSSDEKNDISILNSETKSIREYINKLNMLEAVYLPLIEGLFNNNPLDHIMAEALDDTRLNDDLENASDDDTADV